MTDSEYNAIIRSMREQRILTARQVDERTREHDADDFTARERGAAFDV